MVSISISFYLKCTLTIGRLPIFDFCLKDYFFTWNWAFSLSKEINILRFSQVRLFSGRRDFFRSSDFRLSTLGSLKKRRYQRWLKNLQYLSKEAITTLLKNFLNRKLSFSFMCAVAEFWDGNSITEREKELHSENIRRQSHFGYFC